MADVDIDPFGEHESRPEEPTDENIPLDLVTPGRSSTWETDQGEQETSFGGESQRTKLMKDYVRDLYKKLSENVGETPELYSVLLIFLLKHLLFIFQPLHLSLNYAEMIRNLRILRWS